MSQSPDDMSRDVGAYSVIMIVITVLCMVSRVVSRRMIRNDMGRDDYCFLVGAVSGALSRSSLVWTKGELFHSLVQISQSSWLSRNLLYLAFTSGTTDALPKGEKKVICLFQKPTSYDFLASIPVLTEQALLTQVHAGVNPTPQLNYSYNILGAANYPLIKMSIIFLYLRLFGIHRRFRIAAWIAVAILAANMISITLVAIFTCSPPNAFYDPTVKATYCIDDLKLSWAQASLNVITDVIVILLPVRELCNLQISFKKKAGLAMLFALGGLTVVLSILRIVYYQQFDATDPSYSSRQNAFAAPGEVCLAIILACAMTWRPLVESIITTIGGRFSRLTYGSKGSGSGRSGGPNTTTNLSRSQKSADSLNDKYCAHGHPAVIHSKTPPTVGAGTGPPPVPTRPSGYTPPGQGGGGGGIDETDAYDMTVLSTSSRDGLRGNGGGFAGNEGVSTNSSGESARQEDELQQYHNGQNHENQIWIRSDVDIEKGP
ncbi:MAG: hypothetical protein M1831_007040 [Alyxoria varia]|nr:MAG: hypothetical protein M1831_007040 [Alyxoria varia]